MREPSVLKSPVSDSPILTPTSSTSSSWELRDSTFAVNSRGASPRTEGDYNSDLDTHRFSPSSTPFAMSSELSVSPHLTCDSDNDPDTLLPSIETDFATLTCGQSVQSGTFYTPGSTHEPLVRARSEGDELSQNFQELNLMNSDRTETPASQHHASTPSINVTPVAVKTKALGQSPPYKASLIDEMNTLRMDGSPGASSTLKARRGSPSPTPSGRSRSGSRFDKDPHRVEDEDPPHARFHTKEVQDALSTAKLMMSRLAGVLSSSNMHKEENSSVNNLHRQATELRDFELHSSRTVGLVGDSGAGKSSLINALLDRRDFARASSSGSACTCVATEYHNHDREDFIIQIDYFTLDELAVQYRELLRAYREYQVIQADAEPKREDDDALQRAELANATFQASFGERLEHTPTILTSMPFEKAVLTMLEWATQQISSRSPYGNLDGSRETLSSVEQCSSRLNELTSQVAQPYLNTEVRTCPWPFVKKLRVYLKSYILSKGLVIADLPGFRDSNSARQNVTERYMRDCHQLFIVVDIGRAITDKSVKDIFELARRANLLNVSVVCTRTDVYDVNAEEARKDWPNERNTIDAMQERIQADKDKVSELEEQLMDYESDDDDWSYDERRLVATLEREQKKVEKNLSSHKFDLYRHIITVRNTHVMRSIREVYQHHPAAVNMHIFCVSKHMYWEHRYNPASQATSHLQLSGIIGLRRHCIGMVAESHLRATKDFVKNEIPAFIASLEIWLQADLGNASAESKQQILEVVEGIQGELDELMSPASKLNEVSLSLQSAFRVQIHRYMSSDRQVSRWSDSARIASEIWGGWHHMSYKAFCTHHGTWSTATVPYHCWNEEALAGLSNDMMPIWKRFTLHALGEIEQTEQPIVHAFGKSIEKSQSTSRGSNKPCAALNPLTSALRHRQTLVLHAIDDIIEDVGNQLSDLCTDSFSTPDTAFIGQLMKATYEAANSEEGLGSHGRRKSLVTTRFGSPSLLSEHRRLLRDAFTLIADSFSERMQGVVQQQVSHIKADLLVIKSDNVVLDSEKDPKFNKAVRREVERSNDELRSIRRNIEKVGA